MADLTHTGTISTTLENPPAGQKATVKLRRRGDGWEDQAGRRYDTTGQQIYAKPRKQRLLIRTIVQLPPTIITDAPPPIPVPEVKDIPEPAVLVDAAPAAYTFTPEDVSAGPEGPPVGAEDLDEGPVPAVTVEEMDQLLSEGEVMKKPVPEVFKPVKKTAAKKRSEKGAEADKDAS